jgi:hypothetical protein
MIRIVDTWYDYNCQKKISIFVALTRAVRINKIEVSYRPTK